MLTRKEEKVMQFITRYISLNGHGPTLEEIGLDIGVRSRGTVHRYVKALEEKGHIQRAPNWRGIRLTGEGVRGSMLLPLVGRVSAGKPIEAIIEQETINIPELLSGDGRYALKVSGDSMIDAGIHNGDFVVIQFQQTAKIGDIVVALIDDHEATIKRYFPAKNEIKLLPENANMSAQFYSSDRVQIQGVVVAKIGFFNSID